MSALSSSAPAARRCVGVNPLPHPRKRPLVSNLDHESVSESTGQQIGVLIIATSGVQLANGFFGTFISLRIGLENFEATIAGLVLSSRIRQESPLSRLRSLAQRTYASTRRRRREREGLGYSQRQMPAGQPASGTCAQVAASHINRPPASACMLKPPIRALPETIAPNGQ